MSRQKKRIHWFQNKILIEKFKPFLNKDGLTTYKSVIKTSFLNPKIGFNGIINNGSLKQMTDYRIFSETELIALLKEGDNAARIIIFERYNILLFSFAYRRLNDKEFSKEIVFDCFTNIWEQRQMLNIEADLAAFLFTDIKKRILEKINLRKANRDCVNHFQSDLDNHQDATDHLKNDLSSLIQEEIDALPQSLRAEFILNRQKTMNRKQIAADLGLPENTIKTDLSNALKHFRLLNLIYNS